MTTTCLKHVTVRIPRPLDRWLRIEAAIRDILSRAAGFQEAARNQEVQHNG